MAGSKRASCPSLLAIKQKPWLFIRPAPVPAHVLAHTQESQAQNALLASADNPALKAAQQAAAAATEHAAAARAAAEAANARVAAAEVALQEQTAVAASEAARAVAAEDALAKQVAAAEAALAQSVAAEAALKEQRQAAALQAELMGKVRAGREGRPLSGGGLKARAQTGNVRPMMAGSGDADQQAGTAQEHRGVWRSRVCLSSRVGLQGSQEHQNSCSEAAVGLFEQKAGTVGAQERLEMQRCCNQHAATARAWELVQAQLLFE